MIRKVERLLLKNGRVFVREKGIFEPQDVLIVNGIIEQVGSIRSTSGEVIDLKGACVAPGFVDMHVHLREPGREDEETLETGAEAAMAGGFTQVCCMPNTNPPIDTRGAVEFIKKRSQDFLVEIHPIGAVTKGRAGQELTEMADLLEAGAVAFSDDGAPVATSEIMRRALEYAKMFEVPIIDHCEDQSLTENRHMNEGLMSTILGLSGAPPVAEEIVVARDLFLAAYTGGYVHIAHVSTRGAVELIRQARARGVRVTCEVCPHHFTLTDEAIRTFDTNAKVNPPLRTAEDIQALKEGLQDGTIDVIASDHAPHSIEEKDVEFIAAPPGLIGMETALGLAITQLVDPGILTLPQLVEKMSLNPAKILRLGEKRITPGVPADLTLFDPEQEWEVNVHQFRSKSRNCPFHGWKLKGKVLGVINRGKIWQPERN